MLRFEHCIIKNAEFSLKANFDISTGDRVAIIGPSGAGKSTLLEAISGFRDVTEGSITWNDRDLVNLSPGQRPMAMLFQDGNLFPHLTAAQNVALGVRPNGRLSRQEQTQVINALHRVGLSDMETRKPKELSGGQQSRVALARVLMQRREILLLDEPFAALGPALKSEMLDLVAELVAETAAILLMVSHDPRDAIRIASHTVLVADGLAHSPVATSVLFNDPPPSLRDYLGTTFQS